MAQIYANAAGIILGCEVTFWQASQATPPVGTAFTIDFDENTNQALLQDFAANSSQYSAPNGVLNKNSSPVAITAASAIYGLYNTIITGISKATLETTITALWNATATTTQQQKAIAYLAIVLHAKLGVL